MTSPCAVSDDRAPLPTDLLTEVELRIARRADEFVRALPGRSMLNLQCWLMAEAELFGRDSARRQGMSPDGR